MGTPRGSSPAPAASSQLGGGVLPRRHCVLVAKQLTNSDASSGRIILPRVAVESNLSFVLGYRHYALAVRDCNGASGLASAGAVHACTSAAFCLLPAAACTSYYGLLHPLTPTPLFQRSLLLSAGRCYEFMIKSWANGTEHRRVFVLEQAGEFLRGHGVGVGDAVGICTDENGESGLLAGCLEAGMAGLVGQPAQQGRMHAGAA